MKRLSLLILFILVGCDGTQFNQSSSASATSVATSSSTQPTYCTVTKTSVGTVITCPDGSTSVIKDGAPGQSGSDGKDAPECSVTQIQPGDEVLPLGGAVVQCGASSALISNGAQGEKGDKGDAGDQGIAGQDGVDGTNGTNGINDTNGRDGVDAQPSAYGISAVIDPCGKTPGYTNEILLKLNNGTLLCLFSDNDSGKNSRLAILSAGAYITTDGTSCRFNVDSNNNVTW